MTSISGRQVSTRTPYRAHCCSNSKSPSRHASITISFETSITDADADLLLDHLDCKKKERR
jgi:hypothetical protein